MNTGEIKQEIISFHQDEAGDWVAVLRCGHRRHVRHNPPWTNHPWVVTPAGRQQFIGVEIECKQCYQENSGKQNEQRQLAEAIRQACLQAALAGYEDAGLSGLCHQGAWECAIDAIRSLDINAIIEQSAFRRPD
jgi:hypothetical protein